ncbi:hypothetical protein AURDEDRAFT_174244 [Auricularia subglabra TFB-10046 SS5]|uniref:Uncharacterized protein n=1 Tax=Auricularia subglabra (strain TFB-10046 / SS5) TaxID=717982 RepID=J0CZ56_AURST|nr:hypothetical protein AURDEDRAFT_174244 [Auricularia subglabra TFB-10046 SS5]
MLSPVEPQLPLCSRESSEHRLLKLIFALMDASLEQANAVQNDAWDDGQNMKLAGRDTFGIACEMLHQKLPSLAEVVTIAENIFDLVKLVPHAGLDRLAKAICEFLIRFFEICGRKVLFTAGSARLSRLLEHTRESVDDRRLLYFN